MDGLVYGLILMDGRMMGSWTEFGRRLYPLPTLTFSFFLCLSLFSSIFDLSFFTGKIPDILYSISRASLNHDVYTPTAKLHVSTSFSPSLDPPHPSPLSSFTYIRSGIHKPRPSCTDYLHVLFHTSYVSNRSFIFLLFTSSFIFLLPSSCSALEYI